MKYTMTGKNYSKGDADMENTLVSTA